MMNGGMMYNKGDIVFVSFPYSDLSSSKKRPVVILAIKDDDLIVCSITSNPNSEGLPLGELQEGKLAFQSKVKYWQIFTYTNSLVLHKIGKIGTKDHQELISRINDFIAV